MNNTNIKETLHEANNPVTFVIMLNEEQKRDGKLLESYQHKIRDVGSVSSTNIEVPRE